MKCRRGLILIVASLCALIAVSFAWPHMMVAPGPLIPAHAAINRDCFACHVPFRGASVDRCTVCHKIAEIGIRTTKGTAIGADWRGIAFHQFLAQPDCIACHSDHSGPLLVKSKRQRFAHDLLMPELSGRCASCHRAPQTGIHAQAGSNCVQCHTQKGWKPASFDHARFFALTGPHDTRCINCHVGGNLDRYSCYSCHEHQPDQIRAQHVQEGIRNIENCARCHRNGSAEGGEREGSGRDDD